VNLNIVSKLTNSWIYYGARRNQQM
jgi:hypothetical protein